MNAKPAPAPHHLDERLAPITADRARYMRRAATGLLVLMAGVFLVARQFEHVHPAWGFVHAFAEAAMVGGLADWFAVTALFRHPMGIPIPHTAIIPNNKDRIADSMARFLRENFLIPQVVARRLRQTDFSTAAGSFLLENPQDGEARLRAGAANMFADVLESLDPEELGGQAKAALRGQLERVEIAPLLGQMLQGMIADQRHRPVIDAAIHRAALTIEENEELIRTMIAERANGLLRWTGLDGRVANSVLDGLYKLMAETLVDKDHPLRNQVKEALENLADRLQNDPEMQDDVERLKRELLENPAVGHWIDGMWERVRRALLSSARNPSVLRDGSLGNSFDQLGHALKEDARLQFLVNRFSRRTLVGVANRYGDQIVRLVSETVRRWDAGTVTGRIENAVGRDLQFIRINGTLVGGLVGITIHTVDVLL